jgi:hypothetical protein
MAAAMTTVMVMVTVAAMVMTIPPTGPPTDDRGRDAHKKSVTVWPAKQPYWLRLRRWQ